MNADGFLATYSEWREQGLRNNINRNSLTMAHFGAELATYQENLITNMYANVKQIVGDLPQEAMKEPTDAVDS